MSEVDACGRMGFDRERIVWMCDRPEGHEGPCTYDQRAGHMPDLGRCEWWVLCTEPAAVVIDHPVLGPVPVCLSCLTRIARIDPEIRAAIDQTLIEMGRAHADLDRWWSRE